MKILAIDTTTNFLCLALRLGEETREYRVKLGRQMLSLLIPHIERVLEASGVKASQIDYFACGTGPGSFTGIRVGLSAVKGLCWALQKPAVGVSTLDILARNAPLRQGYVVPLLDARRGMVYGSIYKVSGGVFKRASAYALQPPEDFLKKVKRGSIFLGDALSLYRDPVIRRVKGALLLDQDYWQLQPAKILEVALEKINGGQVTDAFGLKPLYLYPKECQITKN